MPTTTRNGGTVKEAKWTDGPVYSAKVWFPAASPPPPPEGEVTYSDISKEAYEAFRSANGKSGVTVSVTTDDSSGAVKGVAEKSA